MPVILVVDDEEGVRGFIRRALEAAGHRIVEAADGKQALHVFRRERPDLVITDIIMPDCDGIETIVVMKDEDPQVKILAVSGGGRAHRMDLLELAPRAGADAVLEKPFRHAQLLECVAPLLAASAGRRAGLSR